MCVRLYQSQIFFYFIKYSILHGIHFYWNKMSRYLIHQSLGVLILSSLNFHKVGPLQSSPLCVLIHSQSPHQRGIPWAKSPPARNSVAAGYINQFPPFLSSISLSPRSKPQRSRETLRQVSLRSPISRSPSPSFPLFS